MVFAAGPARRVAHNDISGLALGALDLRGHGYMIDGNEVDMSGAQMTFNVPDNGSVEVVDLPLNVSQNTYVIIITGPTSVRLTAVRGNGELSVGDPTGRHGQLRISGPRSTFSGTVLGSDATLEYTGSGSPTFYLTGGSLHASTPVSDVYLTRDSYDVGASFYPGDFTNGPQTTQVKNLNMEGDARIVLEPRWPSASGSGYPQVLVAPGGSVGLSRPAGQAGGISFPNMISFPDSCAANPPPATYVAIHHLQNGGTNGPVAAIESFPSGHTYAAPEGGATFFCGRWHLVTYAAGAYQNDLEFSPSHGYNILTSAGGIYSFGSARYWGNQIDHGYPSPAIGLSSTPDGGGYNILTTVGGIYSFGNANYFGNLIDHGYPGRGSALGMTNTGGGYAILTEGGGFYNFGDAIGLYYGNLIDHHYPGRAVSYAWTASNHGYWILTDAGSIYSFGDAAGQYYGSAADHHLAGAAVGITRSVSGNGYQILMADGHVYGFGDSAGQYLGDMVTNGYPVPAAAIATTP